MINDVVYKRILSQKKAGSSSVWVLLDPDDYTPRKGAEAASKSQGMGVGAILIGGSILNTSHFNNFVKEIKEAVSVPVILFPGDATQLSPHADAVLFLSLVSGRNPTMLIGEHVKGAPLVKHYGIEPISTAYMLIESGAVSSVEFMSNTRPIPRSKPSIAASHALAAQYMGMKLIYLEAGSGAPKSVPPETIRLVRETVEMPIIVGGGIRDEKTAFEKVESGADIVVAGNVLKEKDGLERLRIIINAVKKKR